MRAFFCLALALAGCGAVTGAESALVIPTAEARVAPSPERRANLLATAQRQGWGAVSAPLQAAAVDAYQSGHFDAAHAWYFVGRWAWQFGETETQFVVRWRQALAAAPTTTTAEPVLTQVRPRPIADALQPEFQAWLLGDTAFAESFFGLLSPVDHVPRALQILGTLHFRDPERFTTYAQLALALALVGDVPPPAVWPHRQVTAAALPRRLLPADEALAWWVRQDRLGRTAHPLARLGAAELKFVVDAAAPVTELEWAGQVADFPLAELGRAYAMVGYRQDRVAQERVIWPGATYRLPDILAEGGICVDQAYFAATGGKARGVPTLQFHGAGRESRHAWFGFLDGARRWQLDAGREGEQRFVTGYALDPQTWCALSDHELQFLAEGFQARPAFREARVHADFATAFLAAGDAPAAVAAARRALALEPRQPPVWETLAAATRDAGGGAAVVEAVWREALRALARHPDLEAALAGKLAASLRARGEAAAADAEERRIAAKNQRRRVDLSLQQQREALMRAIATQPLPEQVRTYEAAVAASARRAGVAFFDQLVAPFIGHLLDLRARDEAQRALEHARRAMAVEAGSQLERDFERLRQTIRVAP